MPFRLIRLVALPGAALLALTACNTETPEAADDTARAASGEVLEGSISDAMLPLETLDSQPPVAAPLPSEVSAAAAGGAEEGEDQGATGDPAPEPDAEEASEPAE